MKIKPAFFMFLIIFILVSSVHASSTLTITVATSSQDYLAGEDIEIFGNLTLNGLPVQALVALQVNDPLDSPKILRTLQTGEDYEVGSFEIISFYSCDQLGNPKAAFEAGTLAWLKMSVKNTGNTTEYVLVMANAYDSNNSNLGLSAGAFLPVMGGKVLTKISSLYIPTSASPGNATAYVSALTNWPTQGGVPYYPEMSAQFEIISQQGSGGQSSPAQGSQISENGTYNLTFKLLTDARLGDYTVCVGSTYQGEGVTESTTFNLSGPLLVHDVAVIDIRTSSYEIDIKTQLIVTISVDVANEGDFPETFSVTVRYDSEDIDTKTVTDLPAGDSTTVDFEWPVTGVPLRTPYTIEAEAILAGDDDQTNNKKTSEWTIEIVPEFPQTLAPFLLLIATLAATMLGKYSKRIIRKS